MPHAPQVSLAKEIAHRAEAPPAAMQEAQPPATDTGELQRLVWAHSDRLEPIAIKKRSPMWKRFRHVTCDGTMIEGVVVCRGCGKVSNMTNYHNSWNNLTRHLEICIDIDHHS
jgi:hypothetical protein